MKSFILGILFYMAVAIPTIQAADSNEMSSAVSEQMATKMEVGWKTAWTRFFSPQTKLFYDFISSYEPGHELDHLPTEEEVRRQYPNECGYGTAMEDCMISAGVLLPMVIDRFAVTADESLKRNALTIFEGIEACSTVHGSSGFVARGISPKAPNCVYINSSRDQVTHAVYALWEYYHSPLANDSVKKRIEKILTEIANRMEKNVIPENNYDFLCADGSPGRYGNCRMYMVHGHEAARLPMIYAATWSVTRNRHYYDLWRKYIDEAVDLSLNMERNTDVKRLVPSYALLQMQVSLVLLHQLETNEQLRQKMEQAMTRVKVLAADRLGGAVRRMKQRDLTVLAPDWRKAGGLNGEYRKTWYSIRESGELALTQLLYQPQNFPPEQKKLFFDAILMPDYEHISTCGLFDLLGAYWKFRR